MQVDQGPSPGLQLHATEVGEAGPQTDEQTGAAVGAGAPAHTQHQRVRSGVQGCA